MNVQSISRFGVSALSAGLSIAVLGVVMGPAYPTQAALIEDGTNEVLSLAAARKVIDSYAADPRYTPKAPVHSGK